MSAHESEQIREERLEQSRGERRSLRAVAADDYVPDSDTYVRACPGCGTPGALHGEVCPRDPWHEDARWCDFCLGPLRPDEPAEKPCDRCVAEKHDERRKDYDDGAA